MEPVVVRTGETVWVRPIRADDAVELQRAFALLSELSRYRRFLAGTPGLTDRLARFFAAVDHVQHEALVAFPAEHSTEIVGVARFVRHGEPPTEADLALTVADRWQGRGLGTTLLGLLSERARAVGLHRFTVDMLADNAAVLALVRNAGVAGEELVGQTVTGHIALQPVVVPLSGKALLRTAAAEPVVAVPRPIAATAPWAGTRARALVTLAE